MSDAFILSIVFAAGVFLQSFLLVGKRLLRYWGLILLVGVVSFLMTFVGDFPFYVDPLAYSLVISLTFLSFLLAVFAKRHILPRIHETNVLHLTLIFWYVLLVSQSEIALFLLLIPSIIASIGVAIISFVKVKLNFFWKLFFYVWFLIMNVVLVFFQFSFGTFNKITLRETQLAPIDVPSVFITGMLFVLLVVLGWYIFELFPIPGKNQSFKSRMEDWREHTALLVKKYSDYQLEPKTALFIILIQGGLLGLNYFFRLFPDVMVINLSLLVVTEAVFFQKK